MSGDFDGPATAAGTVQGVRVFDTDEHGRLTGVTHADVWTPGTNIAVCQALTDEGGRPAVGRGHRAGTSGCSCGFWAHTVPDDDYVSPQRWTAVVEGWGLVTRGTRGWRAERARIVALAPPATQTTVTHRTARLYGETGVTICATVHDMLDRHPDACPTSIDTSGDFWTQNDVPDDVDKLFTSMQTFSISTGVWSVPGTRSNGGGVYRNTRPRGWLIPLTRANGPAPTTAPACGDPACPLCITGSPDPAGEEGSTP